jgi:hypothetical protein
MQAMVVAITHFVVNSGSLTVPEPACGGGHGDGSGQGGQASAGAGLNVGLNVGVGPAPCDALVVRAPRLRIWSTRLFLEQRGREFLERWTTMEGWGPPPPRVRGGRGGPNTPHSCSIFGNFI